jgi:methyl-accepting chemotaxis protein
MAASQRIYADYAEQVRGGIYLSNAERAMWELRFGVAQFMLLDDQAREKILAEGPKWYDEMAENLKAYANANKASEEKEAVKQFEDVFGKYKDARSNWFELYRAGKKECLWRRIGQGT